MRMVVDAQGNLWHNDSERRADINRGVNAAHACMAFQCEICWMRNLENRDPTREDLPYVQCIRRANLDAITGMSRATVNSHRLETLTTVRNAAGLNKTPSLHERGPFPLADQLGMGTAVDMLEKSRKAKGRNEEYIQYGTMRRGRSTASRSYQTSPAGVAEAASFSKGAYRVRPTNCPTQSDWFGSFLLGAQARMGHKTRTNKSVPIEVMVKLLGYVARDALAMEMDGEQAAANELWKMGAYYCTLTAGSLRSNEGFFLELAGMNQHLSQGRDGAMPAGFQLKTNRLLTEEECRKLPHVAICLLGKFKGGVGYDHHIINVASVSMSGLRSRWWLEKLMEVCRVEGRCNGPAFATPDGRLASSIDYNAVFRRYLKEVQRTTDLIPEDEDVDEHYSIYRTPRRTALNRAKRAGVKEPHLSEMNRWSREEGAGTKRVCRSMSAHYTDAVMMMPTTWLYSYAL
jgi:hypothetical protein